MARNSAADVGAARIRGTTEYVPSFWMLACIRSLTKRERASSRYLRPGAQQIKIQRRPASPTIRGGPAERAHTSAMVLRPRSRIARRTASWPCLGAFATAPGSSRAPPPPAEMREDRLDLRGARAARGRRLGVRAHRVERRQPLAGNGGARS